MHRVSWRLAWRVGGVAGPLLFLFLAAPSRAGATCGDYVIVHNSKTTAHPTPHDAPHAPGLLLPDLPCRGHNCSRSDAPPVLPVPATTPVSVEQWASLIPFVRPSVPDASMLLPVDSPPPSMRLPCSIIRPPSS